jgi:hypothetical protein
LLLSNQFTFQHSQRDIPIERRARCGLPYSRALR